jgi:hypothetical protein
MPSPSKPILKGPGGSWLCTVPLLCACIVAVCTVPGLLTHVICTEFTR